MGFCPTSKRPGSGGTLLPMTGITPVPPEPVVGEEVVHLRIAWQPEGTIERTPGGRRRFTDLDNSPGVYRIRFLDLEGSVQGVYVGEATDVRDRVRRVRYREEVILWIDATLEHGGSIAVDRLADVTVTSAEAPDEHGSTLNMASQVGRLAAEGIAASREDYWTLLNADEFVNDPEGRGTIRPVPRWWEG